MKWRKTDVGYNHISILSIALNTYLKDFRTTTTWHSDTGYGVVREYSFGGILGLNTENRSWLSGLCCPIHTRVFIPTGACGLVDMT